MYNHACYHISITFHHISNTLSHCYIPALYPQHHILLATYLATLANLCKKLLDTRNYSFHISFFNFHPFLFHLFCICLFTFFISALLNLIGCQVKCPSANCYTFSIVNYTNITGRIFECQAK